MRKVQESSAERQVSMDHKVSSQNVNFSKNRLESFNSIPLNRFESKGIKKGSLKQIVENRKMGLSRQKISGIYSVFYTN